MLAEQQKQEHVDHPYMEQSHEVASLTAQQQQVDFPLQSQLHDIII